MYTWVSELMMLGRLALASRSSSS